MVKKITKLQDCSGFIRTAEKCSGAETLAYLEIC